MALLSEGIRTRVSAQYQRALTLLADIDVTGDPEALHQYRVSLRKARSLLTLFRAPLRETPAGLISEMLAEQASIANLARDLDVFWPQLADGALKRRIGQWRTDAYEAFIAASTEQERDREVVQWLLMLNWPCNGRSLEEETGRVRDELLVNIERQCERLMMSASSRQWHRLRILIKRWRYLESLCGAPADLSSLKAGQTLLGEFNDLCCQRKLLKCLQKEAALCPTEARQLRQTLKQAKWDKKTELDHWLHGMVAKKGALEAVIKKSR
ncbi:CHAD domain-containing protein [Marinobacter hydrocarbonoclasticus]|nr:CHAD domain-containing protein [Marinobacter nauticus]